MKLIVPKKYQNLFIETGRQRVLEILFKFPEKEFSLTELAKLAHVAKANIGVILNELSDMGFIEIIKLSSIWRIKANMKNPNFIQTKIVYNLSFIYSSGLIEFLNEHFKNPKAIILFGSFRKGEDISNSDIDIAVESSETRDYQIIELKELAGLEKAIGRKIQIHLFNKEKMDIHLFNNIANGIVMAGFLEVGK